MERVTVVAVGKFRVSRKQFASHKCGVGGILVSFTVKVESQVGALDDRGFVVDVRDVHGYFREKYEKARAAFKSCEVVAIEACHHFGHGITSRVVTNIQASPLGFAEAEWRR